MWRSDKQSRALLGKVLLTNVQTLLAYETTPILTVLRSDQSGDLGINCRVYDERGHHVASVSYNHLREADHLRGSFTFERSPNHLKLEETKTGLTLCEIQSVGDSGSSDLNVSVRLFLPNGELFEATPKRMVSHTNYQLDACTIIRDSKIGFGFSGEGELRLGATLINPLNSAPGMPMMAGSGMYPLLNNPLALSSCAA